MWVLVDDEEGEIQGPFATKAHAEQWLAEHGRYQFEAEPDVVRVHRPITKDYDINIVMSALQMRDDYR